MSGGAFYLDPDDAKSLGDINYMRKPMKVKKSFPKMAAGKAVSIPEETPKPAMEMAKKIVAESSTSEATTNGAADRRRPDANLDMFRSMARDMKK
ncbi:MAG: hypothetical protein ACP5D7_15790 [Limnospira sp.]